jgi:hypothetical protein
MPLFSPSRRAGAALLATAATAAVLGATLVAPTAATAAPTGGLKPEPPAGARPPAAWSTGTTGQGKAVFPPNWAFVLERGDRLVKAGTPDAEYPSSIISYGIPPGGADGPWSGLGTYLVLQSDGNLVEYEYSTGAVLFTTGTKTGTDLIYQQDGNLVLYDATGKALWSTLTAGREGDYLTSYGDGEMLLATNDGQIVRSFGKTVTTPPGVVYGSSDSPNGKYRLEVQKDGNVVAYNVSGASPKAFWSTGTSGKGRVRLAAQADGNLVVYAYPTNKVLWQTRTGTSTLRTYYQLDMQNDGNIVLYRTDGSTRTAAVWASRTKG